MIITGFNLISNKLHINLGELAYWHYSSQLPYPYWIEKNDMNMRSCVFGGHEPATIVAEQNTTDYFVTVALDSIDQNEYELRFAIIDEMEAMANADQNFSTDLATRNVIQIGVAYADESIIKMHIRLGDASTPSQRVVRVTM